MNTYGSVDDDTFVEPPDGYVREEDGMTAKYIVMVDDNFHYMDESERYTAGEYDTYDEAEEKCREIVRSSLAELGYDFEAWKHYGEDPFVRGSNLPRKFSARSYAEELCKSFPRKNPPEERPAR